MRSRLPSLLAALLAISGCGEISTHAEDQALQTTLLAYANALRWRGFDEALKFVDPATLERHPPTPLDRERYRQVRVVSYSEQPIVPLGKHEVQQTVEIGLVNLNTQTERTIIDHQIWRYDTTGKRWHLVSGLPDITQH
jgi:hypothetical protein